MCAVFARSGNISGLPASISFHSGTRCNHWLNKRLNSEWTSLERDIDAQVLTKVAYGVAERFASETWGDVNSCRGCSTERCIRHLTAQLRSACVSCSPLAKAQLSDFVSPAVQCERSTAPNEWPTSSLKSFKRLRSAGPSEAPTPSARHFDRATEVTIAPQIEQCNESARDGRHDKAK